MQYYFYNFKEDVDSINGNLIILLSAVNDNDEDNLFFKYIIEQLDNVLNKIDITRKNLNKIKKIDILEDKYILYDCCLEQAASCLIILRQALKIEDNEVQLGHIYDMLDILICKFNDMIISIEDCMV